MAAAQHKNIKAANPMSPVYDEAMAYTVDRNLYHDVYWHA